MSEPFLAILLLAIENGCFHLCVAKLYQTFRFLIQRNYYLVKVVKGFVKVGMHASRWFVGDLDRVFENSLRNNVAVCRCCWLSADEDPEIAMASHTVLFQFVLKG